jgi:hypothetical protein
MGAQGFVDFEANVVHMDATDEDFAWFWLEIYTPY